MKSFSGFDLMAEMATLMDYEASFEGNSEYRVLGLVGALFGGTFVKHQGLDSLDSMDSLDSSDSTESSDSRDSR